MKAAIVLSILFSCAAVAAERAPGRPALTVPRIPDRLATPPNTPATPAVAADSDPNSPSSPKAVQAVRMAENAADAAKKVYEAALKDIRSQEVTDLRAAEADVMKSATPDALAEAVKIDSVIKEVSEEINHPDGNSALNAVTAHPMWFIVHSSGGNNNFIEFKPDGTLVGVTYENLWSVGSNPDKPSIVITGNNNRSCEFFWDTRRKTFLPGKEGNVTVTLSLISPSGRTAP